MNTDEGGQTMTSTILLTGGTGTLGRHITPLLQDAGFKLRVLSRHSHQPRNGIDHVSVDLLEGKGIEPAVDGADTIVHLAGGPKGDDQATRNLMRAAKRAGVQHVIYISVIAADKVPLDHFKSKLGAEQAVAQSGIPYTTLRAAQFHNLILKSVQTMAKLPVIPIPAGLRFQPVDSREVAARLAELTVNKPTGRVPDLAGPKVYGMAELVRGYLRARTKHRLLIPIPIPGKAGKAYRAGDNLNLTDAITGTQIWEAFLAEQTLADPGR
jgi:uncharacterized protein YbjT (DUF2867 family)